MRATCVLPYRADRANEKPLPDALLDAARRLERLSVDHRDPERFFLDRSEIAAELRRLARANGRAAA